MNKSGNLTIRCIGLSLRIGFFSFWVLFVVSFLFLLIFCILFPKALPGWMPAFFRTNIMAVGVRVAGSTPAPAQAFLEVGPNSVVIHNLERLPALQQNAVVASEKLRQSIQQISVLQFVFFMLCGLIILHQLRGIFATLRNRRVFASRNAVRVRIIALIILVSVPLKSLFKYLASNFFVRHVSMPGVVFVTGFSFDLVMLFVGIIILMLAEVFHQGALLQEESELVV